MGWSYVQIRVYLRKFLGNSGDTILIYGPQMGDIPYSPLSREKVAVWKCSDSNELQDESPWGHTSPLGP